MRVNGAEITLSEVCDLKTFLEREGYNVARVAVERNGEIVSRSCFGSELLSDNDRLEIVAFIGGG